MKLQRRHINSENIVNNNSSVITAIIGSNCTKLSNIEQIILDNNISSLSTTNLSIESDDVLINTESDELYHQSVTLTARMWPPVEIGPPSTIWGLPVIIWAIIIGCLVIALLILSVLFFCYWILPRKNKFFSPTRFCDTNNSAIKQESTMSHRSSMISKNWNNESTGHIIVPISVGLIPSSQYNNIVPSSLQKSSSISPHQQQQQQQQNNNNNYHQHQYSLEYSSSPAYGSSGIGSGGIISSGGDGIIGISGGGEISPGESKYSIPETHKSMWVLNPLRGSNTVLSEHDVSFKSRSLPSWGKSKQRPISTTDDLEELYAKVNFSKKRRNRMRNDEAAIIALCRSRSQNLAGLPLEREGVVIYDERTAL